MIHKYSIPRIRCFIEVEHNFFIWVCGYIHSSKTRKDKHELAQLKWDRKKKKYIREDNNDVRKKKMKTESGNWISASYNTDLYALA